MIYCMFEAVVKVAQIQLGKCSDVLLNDVQFECDYVMINVCIRINRPSRALIIVDAFVFLEQITYNYLFLKTQRNDCIKRVAFSDSYCQDRFT